MAYEMESIRLSQLIFYHLLQKSTLSEKDEPELFKAYVENEDIMNLVKSQGEIAECRVECYGSVIYIMPESGNVFLGFSRNELKRELCKSNATEKDYYLSQFIILTLLAEFYDGQGSRCKTRNFVKMGELQNIVSERLRAGVSAEEETEKAEKTGLDYRSMSEAFESLRSEERHSRKKTTKEGVINTILDFLEKQGLIVYVEEDEMIKTSKKLDDIMEMKLLNKNNYERIMQALGAAKEGETDEQDQPHQNHESEL